MTGPAGPVGILCALPQEQELLAAALTDVVSLSRFGLDARRGRLDGRDVVLAAAGVGKVNAAIAGTLLVERTGCRSLVLSGVAGGLPDWLGIGDVVIATRVIDIDYGRITDSGLLTYHPGTLPLPGFEAEPGYLLPAAVQEKVRGCLERAGLRVAMGTILSGDAFLASARVRDELALKWGALAIEMEGSAVCGVAERFGLPWLIVRTLSDRAGDDSIEGFEAFVTPAAATSARLVRELLAAFD